MTLHDTVRLILIESLCIAALVMQPYMQNHAHNNSTDALHNCMPETPQKSHCHNLQCVILQVLQIG